MELNLNFMKHFAEVFVTMLFVMTSSFARENRSSESVPEVLRDLSAVQDVNGFLPEHIEIRTMTQSYCRYYEFALVDGRIYAKKSGENDWKLFMKTGLPFSRNRKDKFVSPKAVREICADGDSLYAFDDQGVLYLCYVHKGGTAKAFYWYKLFGFPKDGFLVQNDLVLDKRGWSMGARRGEILWYEDIYGNQHHYGTMGLETIYFLSADGRHILFTDSGLQQDFSRRIQGPLDGSFIAENISVSGDTIFLIGNKGSMYTRLIDFDTMGCDPMFFQYTYDKVEQKYRGSEYLSNYSPWALPAEGWKEHPKIPLKEGERLTKMISIAQTGKGNESREMKVCGTDSEGRTGYWHKMLNDSEWEFVESKFYLDESAYLDSSESETGEPNLYEYRGYIIKNNRTLDGYSCKLERVSLTSEDKYKFTVSRGNESYSCGLHAVEKWTYLDRYNPGFDGTSRHFFITAETGELDVSMYSPDFADLVKDMFGGKHHALFAISGEATDKFYQIEIEGRSQQTLMNPLAMNNRYKIFMGTGMDSGTEKSMGLVSPDVFKTMHVFTQPIYQKVSDSELILESGREYTVRERSRVQRAVDENQFYKEELKAAIKNHRDISNNAELSRWGYGIVSLITKVTFLDRLNFPKIRQMTSFGSELINTNADNFTELAYCSEWSYNNIIDLLDVRLKYYKKIIEDFDDNKLVSYLDSRVQNSYQDYFAQIGMPEFAVQLGPDGEPERGAVMVKNIPYFPGYVLADKNGSIVLVMFRDSAKKILGVQKKIKNESLDEVLSRRPVKFDVEYYTASLSGNSVSMVKDSRSTAGEYEEGEALWDGKSLKFRARTAIFSGKYIFSGQEYNLSGDADPFQEK